MFEKALRVKLRFEYRGSISVEDLWDVPVGDEESAKARGDEGLDGMFKELNRLNQDEESLLGKDNRDNILNLKIKIIRHVVATKLQERNEAENEKDRADHKAKLLAIYAEKKDDDIRSLPAEEIAKLIDEL